MYIALLSELDIPPYRPPEIVQDQLILRVENRAGSGEMTVSGTGEDRIMMTVSVSLSVECSPGFRGDDCASPCSSESTDPTCKNLG